MDMMKHEVWVQSKDVPTKPGTWRKVASCVDPDVATAFARSQSKFFGVETEIRVAQDRNPSWETMTKEQFNKFYTIVSGHVIPRRAFDTEYAQGARV